MGNIWSVSMFRFRPIPGKMTLADSSSSVYFENSRILNFSGDGKLATVFRYFTSTLAGLSLCVGTAFAAPLKVTFSNGTITGTTPNGEAFTDASYTFVAFTDTESIGDGTGAIYDLEYQWQISNVGVFWGSNADGAVQFSAGGANEGSFLWDPSNLYFQNGIQTIVDWRNQNAFPFASQPLEPNFAFIGNDEVVGGTLTITDITTPTRVTAEPHAQPIPTLSAFSLSMLMLGFFLIAYRNWRRSAM